MFDENEIDDDVMLDGATTIYPSKTGQSSTSSSSSSSQTERIPTSQDSSGIFYDQDGQAMTITKVKAYAARHNLTLNL